MKVLFIGESWVIHMIHSKGYDSFTSTKYEEGATYLLNCLKESEVEVDYMPAHEVQVRFPKTVEELQKYDSIVISDIGSNTFLLQNRTFYQMEVVPNALDLIRNYVDLGGGLLMIGGYLSFMGIEGKANYKNTVLSEVLPVELQDGDDRIEAPHGINPITITQHEITKDIENWPTFLGYNKFKAKQNAEVLVKVMDDPFIVIGNYGKGKTAAFASDCAPHWGTTEFMNWVHYRDVWVRILNFLTVK
ncbi:glutamine amidotransferase [Bacillus sp. DTU_2020_1000418_1_SI_GHA_SEK_038]|uniref:glutamine amidotransferase n=1 Tax=Bacillus sp. DTU_2020_1000418_1_SI_GHA_SEK_038 TaxID=3077585 RepID=UPI0028EDF198|nr:glutamine amidotransferase [Bacillus sp. DTU_2020_1000418_1_SI_GHA_SEK_038]WNS73669.1 glutamine amidotransferase [Bacillus sp. DTU_2020_1000418_1_SI_GHA_SEK_038]